jgi:hypothetical protein
MNFMGDLEMLTREQLQGVLISIAKPQFLITRDERYATGYCVRLAIKMKNSVDLSCAIQRTLLQNEIPSRNGCNIPANKGFITVNGNDNLCKLLELIPKTLPANADWMRFSQALEIVKDGRHQTQEGLDELFRIKGLL